MMDMKDFMKELVNFCKEKHVDELSTRSVVDGYTIRVYVDMEKE